MSDRVGSTEYCRGGPSLRHWQRHFDRAQFLVGTSGNDVICGGKANDILTGTGGNDILLGGDGRDFLSGDVGIDILNGGTGNDYLFGGGDANTLHGNANDDAPQWRHRQ
jgi:Ca2+-binding RTX toxin-like protein